MTRIKTCLLALALASGIAGCGKTSFFEVSVAVNSNAPGITSSCLFTINQCRVTVSGAARDSFTLLDVCETPTSFNLGVFQYDTDKESGNVVFHVDIFNGNLKKLGEGETSKAIKAGGRETLSVTIEPDAAAFGCI